MATAWKDTIVGEKTEDETFKKKVLTVGLSTFAVTTGVALLGGFGIIGTLQSKAVELGKEAIDLFRNVGNVKIPIGFNGEALLGISIGSVANVALGIAGAGIAYGIVSEGIELANAISLMNKMQGESRNNYDDYNDETPRKQRIGRQNGKAPRNNQKQNEQTKRVAKELNLTKDQSEELHRAIGHQGLSYQEILELAKELFGK